MEVKPFYEKIRPDIPLGKRMAELVEKRGISVSALARVSGISRAGVENILKSGAMPEAHRLTAIAKVLDTSTDYLLGLTDRDKPCPPADGSATDRASREIEQGLRGVAKPQAPRPQGERRRRSRRADDSPAPE